MLAPDPFELLDGQLILRHEQIRRSVELVLERLQDSKINFLLVPHLDYLEVLALGIFLIVS